MKLRLLLAFLLCFPVAARAELHTWDCQFDRRVDEGGVAEEQMRLIFVVDDTSNRISMTGNAGTIAVELHVGENVLSFVERVPSGAVHSTTISSDGSAVHSRNTVILGRFVAAQHFGQCIIF
ncbi:MAG: hypothetical protein AAF390_20300 [Pseudomonadota bacterium]